jgi:hypothetical protein
MNGGNARGLLGAILAPQSDAGDDRQPAAAMGKGLDVDGEYPLRRCTHDIRSGDRGPQRVDLGDSGVSYSGSALPREAEQFLWLTKCWLSTEFSQELNFSNGNPRFELSPLREAFASSRIGESVNSAEPPGLPATCGAIDVPAQFTCFTGPRYLSSHSSDSCIS